MAMPIGRWCIWCEYTGQRDNADLGQSGKAQESIQLKAYEFFLGFSTQYFKIIDNKNWGNMRERCYCI